MLGFMYLHHTAVKKYVKLYPPLSMPTLFALVGLVYLRVLRVWIPHTQDRDQRRVFPSSVLAQSIPPYTTPSVPG